MKKKIIILVSIILTILLIMFVNGTINNSNDNIENGEINVVLGSEPNSLDPAISLTIDVRSYMANMFEGLVNLDKNGELKPGVAKEWKPNENNTEYISI